jgi:two-component system response regulator FlrC
MSRRKPSPSVLIVEDDANLREALLDTLELSGYRVLVAANAEAAVDLLGREAPGLVLSDVQMPGMDGHALLRVIKTKAPGLPVVLMTAYGQIERAVEAMRDGAADYLPKPFETDRLIAVVARHLRNEAECSECGLVAEDAASLALLEVVRKVAATEVSVLLTGESGVGKEVYARFLHGQSARAGGPFIAVNCAAIPENLVEATLFGYEKGAYTGAQVAQAGKFEQAQGGTLLLDEVSEIPLQIQAKLLRVLQEKVVERVGGRSLIPLDVRVVAASNRDLANWVREGHFREDLYYRLNVFPIEIPALRQRRGDILPLARHLLSVYADTVGRAGFRLSETAEAELTGYEWPGNIRELGNVLQRAMILAPGAIIEPMHLMLPRQPGRQAQAGVQPEPSGGQIKDMEKTMILETLSKMEGSRKRTAEVLGISERTLRYKLQRYREEGQLDGDFCL